jgi:hypothetical protein
LHQLNVVCRPAKVNPCIAPLRPADLLEALAERSDPSLSFTVALRIRHQHADAPHAFGRLRLRRDRPRRHATEQRHEIAPL